MFGGLTKTSSRIAIAAALGMTLGGFAMSATPAKAADLGGDCCADLEERVAELEATTVRKGNKKVSVTLSGWVVKLGSWWDDGHETNFYVGDKDTTLSSHFQISGSATISPGWSAGYTIAVETAGQSASVGFCENQFNDDCALFGDINTLLSYMWIKSDAYGTINWGQLSQATDNVALLPDLSGTVIESNAVVFDGAGMFVRAKGAKNSNDIASEFAWGAVLTCNSNGGGLGADCNGYPQNAFRYDTPTWGGFSASTSYGEDDMWDVALKYAADWNSIKVSAAAGYTLLTDEGCSAFGVRMAAGLAPTSRWSVVAARPSRTIGRMPSCSRSAPLSCMFPLACSPMACIRTTRKTAPSSRPSASTRNASRPHSVRRPSSTTAPACTAITSTRTTYGS